jgi:hypothetical protein
VPARKTSLLWPPPDARANPIDRKSGTRQRSSQSRRIHSRALHILYGSAPIHRLSDDVWSVPSETEGGVYYTVNLRRPTCECPDWRKRKHQCKHMLAAVLYRGGVSAPSEQPSCANEYRNPSYYDRMRIMRRPCVREMLRCISRWVNHG